jgi:hypothetical protein
MIIFEILIEQTENGHISIQGSGGGLKRSITKREYEMAQKINQAIQKICNEEHLNGVSVEHNPLE